MLVASTLLFLLFERNNPTYGGFSTGEKWLVAFFNATTPRTAGFNTIDLESMRGITKGLMIFLMFQLFHNVGNASYIVSGVAYRIGRL